LLNTTDAIKFKKKKNRKVKKVNRRASIKSQ